MLIERPTVFVFGAGASYPFGFPLGQTLIQDILALRHERAEVGSLISTTDLDAFKRALQDTDVTSIDRFLEHRHKFWDIGRIAIAAVLLPKERRNNLSRLIVNESDAAYGRWFGNFFEFLIARVKPDDFCKHNMTLVTLNYERSLETMLHQGVMAAYGLSSEDAATLLERFPVHHLHGSFGALPWQDRCQEKALGFGTAWDVADMPPRIKAVKQAAAGIRIVHEENLAESEAYCNARDAIANAENVVFLGFGFDPVTIDRLLGPGRRKNIRLFATGFQVHPSVHELLRHHFGGEDYTCGEPSERLHDLLPRWMPVLCKGKR